MPETVPTENTPHETAPSRTASAASLLAAPAAYAVVAVVNYFLAPAACQLGVQAFGLLRIVAFLLTALGLLVVVWAGYRSYRHVQRASAAGATSDDSSRFLGVGGIMLSVLFAALTIIAGLSGLAGRPCEPV